MTYPLSVAAALLTVALVATSFLPGAGHMTLQHSAAHATM